MYKIEFSRLCEKQRKFLIASNLDKKVKELCKILEVNPYQNPPSYEKLENNLSGFYSRRINLKHRLVYAVLEDTKIVKIASMWSHYEF